MLSILILLGIISAAQGTCEEAANNVTVPSTGFIYFNGKGKNNKFVVRTLKRRTSAPLCHTLTLENQPHPNTSPLMGDNLFHIMPELYNGHFAWTNGPESISFIPTGGGDRGNWLLGNEAGVDSGYVYLDSSTDSMMPIGQESEEDNPWKWLLNGKWEEQKKMFAYCKLSTNTAAANKIPTTADSITASSSTTMEYYEIEYFAPNSNNGVKEEEEYNNAPIHDGYLFSGIHQQSFLTALQQANNKNKDKKNSIWSSLLGQLAHSSCPSWLLLDREDHRWILAGSSSSSEQSQVNNGTAGAGSGVDAKKRPVVSKVEDEDEDEDEVTDLDDIYSDNGTRKDLADDENDEEDDEKEGDETAHEEEVEENGLPAITEIVTFGTIVELQKPLHTAYSISPKDAAKKDDKDDEEEEERVYTLLKGVEHAQGNGWRLTFQIIRDAIAPSSANRPKKQSTTVGIDGTTSAAATSSAKSSAANSAMTPINNPYLKPLAYYLPTTSSSSGSSASKAAFPYPIEEFSFELDAFPSLTQQTPNSAHVDEVPPPPTTRSASTPAAATSTASTASSFAVINRARDGVSRIYPLSPSAQHSFHLQYTQRQVLSKHAAVGDYLWIWYHPTSSKAKAKTADKKAAKMTTKKAKKQQSNEGDKVEFIEELLVKVIAKRRRPLPAASATATATATADKKSSKSKSKKRVVTSQMEYILQIYPTHRYELMKSTMHEMHLTHLVLIMDQYDDQEDEEEEDEQVEGDEEELMQGLIAYYNYPTNNHSSSATSLAATSAALFITAMLPLGNNLPEFLLTHLYYKEKKLNDMSTCFMYHAAASFPIALIYAAELICFLIGGKPVTMIQYHSPTDHQWKFPLVIELTKGIVAAKQLYGEEVDFAYEIFHYQEDDTLVLYRTPSRRHLMEALRPAYEAQALHPMPFPRDDHLQEDWLEQIYNAAWNGLVLGYPEYFVSSYCREFHNELSVEEKNKQFEKAAKDFDKFLVAQQQGGKGGSSVSRSAVTASSSRHSIGIGLDEPIHREAMHMIFATAAAN